MNLKYTHKKEVVDLFKQPLQDGKVWHQRGAATPPRGRQWYYRPCARGIISRNSGNYASGELSRGTSLAPVLRPTTGNELWHEPRFLYRCLQHHPPVLLLVLSADCLRGIQQNVFYIETHISSDGEKLLYTFPLSAVFIRDASGCFCVWIHHSYWLWGVIIITGCGSKSVPR